MGDYLPILELKLIPVSKVAHELSFWIGTQLANTI